MNGTTTLSFFLSSFPPSVVRFMTPSKMFYKEIFCIWIMYDNSSHCIVRFQRNLTRMKVLVTVTMIIVKVSQICSLIVLIVFRLRRFHFMHVVQQIDLSIYLGRFKLSPPLLPPDTPPFHPQFPSWPFGQCDVFLTWSSHPDPVFLLDIPLYVSYSKSLRFNFWSFLKCVYAILFCLS